MSIEKFLDLAEERIDKYMNEVRELKVKKEEAYKLGGEPLFTNGIAPEPTL